MSQQMRERVMARFRDHKVEHARRHRRRSARPRRG
jgi:hypothetical protein